MAPLRLPKVKSKGKTAPQPESYDDFMEAALVQASRREANCVRNSRKQSLTRSRLATTGESSNAIPVRALPLRYFRPLARLTIRRPASQGDKARRHYEAAVQLYSDAAPLASDSEERHDALYNLCMHPPADVATRTC